MPDSLAALEDSRSRLVLELAQLGDFRRGSIQSLFRRCGKPNCACAQPGHPGHGPVTRLAYKVRGKSVAVTLSAPAEVRKAEREVAAFRRFQQLTAELVDVNERICQLRSPAAQDLAEPPTPLKKNAPRDPGHRQCRSRAVAEGDRQRPAQDRRL